MNRYLIFSVLFSVVSVSVLAQDEFEQVKVLENAKYSLTNRFVFDADFSFLPLDAYYKPILAEAAMTYQFADLFAWEVGRFGYSLHNYDTKVEGAFNAALGDAVKSNGNRPQISENDLRLKDFRYRATSTLLMNLLYSKSNFFNRSISYHLWQIGVGGSYYNFKSKYQTGIDVVLRVRFFFNDHWNMTLRGGHTIGFMKGAPKSITFLGLGAGFAL